MLRYRGGLDHHPEATRFAQLYRLMSIYSLVKPNKGSNVTGGEICHALVTSAATNKVEAKLLKKQIKDKVAKILEREDFDPNCDINIDKEDLQTHMDEVQQAVVGHMAGFVAKTASKRWCSKCSECKNLITMTKTTSLPQNMLIYYRSYGYLVYPSVTLFTLILELEKLILGVLHGGVKEDTMFTVMDKLLESDINFKKVGCKNHQEFLSQEILYYYVTTRMYFASRVLRKLNTTIKKTKELTKKGKLVTRS
jgi:hypothetical protein